MIEPEVRHQIDQSLRAAGWILDPSDIGRNVYFENAVKSQLSQRNKTRLGQKKPDYTFFGAGHPLAVLEAKKSDVIDLQDALDQARDYAERIDVQVIFACNGLSFKSQHLENDQPLFLNGVEVTNPISLHLLEKFHHTQSNELFTVPQEIIKSREEMIQLFSELNDDLRAAGLRAGIERFSEFANILFLKLLSERGDGEIWDELLRLNQRDVIQYMNGIAMTRLRDNYGGDVISPTEIPNAVTIKKIVGKLNPLSLTDVDEDIKGVAFEHFIQKTTDTQNDLGEYFTPRHIVRFMVRLLDPKFGESVYDPFCGTGGFLTESFKHISQQATHGHDTYSKLHSETVFGGEITTTSRIAKMNMILFGDGHSGVKKQDSLKTVTCEEFDNVLSNIPFSQKVDDDVLDFVGYSVKDADQACVMRCFDSLKSGGSMAIVVPDGFLVNRKHAELRRFIFGNSRVRFILKLPRGCFAPYTDAKTGIIYLTGKGVEKTEWFYRVSITNDGFDSKRNPVLGITDLDQVLFFKTETLEPASELPEELDVGIVRVENLHSKHSFYLHEDWKISEKHQYVRLDHVASLENGKSITEQGTTPGNIPVIAGGRGTVPYHHGEFNHLGRTFTVSKSGAYSGYVWWHDGPIWASDSIAIRSKDESRFLTRYLYMCMRFKQEEIYRRQQGTGQPHIYIGHIHDFPIPVMSIDHQRKLFEPLEELHSESIEAKKRVDVCEAAVTRTIESYFTHD